MQLSWVDLFFIGVFLYFAVKGWTHGLVYFIVSFLAFAFSVILALKYASLLSLSVSQITGLNTQWSGLIAYFLLAFAIQALTSAILSRLLTGSKKFGRVSQIVGAFVSATTGLFLVALFFFVLLLIPIRGTIKDDIRGSLIAPRILSFFKTYGGPLPGLLQESADEFSQFMTIATDSDEEIRLRVFVSQEDLVADEPTEAAMLSMLNAERETYSLQPLSTTYALRDLARNYSKKIFLDKRFSHVDQEGKNAGDRLEQANIHFLLAGENLAYAVDLRQAHTGLMNSEGHRKNILDPSFKKVGIGIIDGGIWGKVFTQVFTD
jgi:uncharacterized protein YkwD